MYMLSLWTWLILFTCGVCQIKFGIKTSNQWDALSYLKLTLFYQNSRYQCVINASYANSNTIYECDTSDTQTTYQCDTDSNDVSFGLQIDENQYQSVTPSFFDEVIIETTSNTYNIAVSTDQISRYSLFIPDTLTTWKYVQNMDETALCPPVSSIFGFYLDSENNDPHTLNPVRVTLIWEEARHQCTLYPNINDISIYWNCDTSDTANTAACDASINTHLYALHLQHVSGSDGAAFARVVIKNKYRNDVQINVYEIEYFYSGTPGTESKCLGRTIYDVIWLDDKASSCLNGFPNTLLVFNDFHLDSSRIYNAVSSADCTPATDEPTKIPSSQTLSPTKATNDPFSEPTKDPSSKPTKDPFSEPTKDPSSKPTNDPFSEPTKDPSSEPTKAIQATNDPSSEPRSSPTFYPSNVATFYPSKRRTLNPVMTVIETTESLETTAEESIYEEPKEVKKERGFENVIYAGIIIVSICGICVCLFACILKQKFQHNILSGAAVIPPRVKVEDNEDRESLKEWLKETVELPKYYDLLVSNGYDSLQRLQTIKTKADLVRIGVLILGHQTQLLMEIKALHKETGGKIDVLPIENVVNENNVQHVIDENNIKNHVTLGAAEFGNGEFVRDEYRASVAYAAPFKRQSVSHVYNAEPAHVLTPPPPPVTVTDLDLGEE